MWKPFLAYAFEKLEYGTTEKKIIPKGKYFHISNPFVKDRSPSAVCYYKSGKMKLYNSDVNGKTTLEIWEWCKLLGIYDDYVQYILQFYEITEDELQDNKHLCKRYHIADVGNMSNIDFSVTKLDKLEQKADSEIEEVQLSQFEKLKAIEYIKSLNLKVEDGLRPCRVRIFTKDWEFFRTAICFDYQTCNFKKYRFLTEDKKYRFRAEGQYENFYIAKTSISHKCWLVEGEKDSIIVSKYVGDSVLGLSGTSLPTNLDILKNYDDIEVLLDLDKFYEHSMRIYEDIKKINPTANIQIRPKLMVCFNGEFDTKMDFGNYHERGRLNENIVKRGLLSASDIENKNILEKFDFVLDK